MGRFAKARPLTPERAPKSPDDAQLDRSFRKLAAELGQPGELATVEFRIKPSGRSRRAKTWTLQLTPQEARVTPSTIERPTLRMVMGQDDWWAIARGDASPIEVFLEGRIRMIGDCSVAERLFRRVAGKGIVAV